MKKHGHWVNNLSLNTDYACRTGSCDHTGVVIHDPIQSQKRALERYNAVKGDSNEILVSGFNIFFHFLSQIFWFPIINFLVLISTFFLTIIAIDQFL